MGRSQAVQTAQVGAAAFFAGKNALINGGFDIWQRGTSITGNGFSYGADRWAFWRFNSGTGLSMSQGSGLANSQYTVKVQRISGQTFTDAIYLTYDMETSDSYRFAGKTVTFSFYIRKGSNYSGGDITAAIRTGTGTNQNLFNGYTGGTNIASTTATISSTSTFQRVTLTGTVSSSATQVGVYITYTPTGTANTNDFIEVGQAQLELGSVATEFSRCGGTLAGELAACQRYYYRISAANVYNRFGFGTARTTGHWIGIIQFPVKMRVTPTALDSSAANTFQLYDGSNDIAVTTVDGFGNGCPDNVNLNMLGTGLTQFRPYQLLALNTTSAYLGFSAEL